MQDYLIIDDAIPKENSDLIENLMVSPNGNFEWYLSGTIPTVEQPVSDHPIIHKPETCEVKYQFFHIFYQNCQPCSNQLEHLNSIVAVLNPVSLIRIKSNLQWKTDQKLNKGFHKDTYLDNHLTAIYYVNSNDGLTILEDGTEIESIKNRLLIFKSNLYHSGTTCTDSDFRCVVNFNYYPATKVF